LIGDCDEENYTKYGRNKNDIILKKENNRSKSFYSLIVLVDGKLTDR